MKKRILTGITTTGTPHIGNYIGAIRPALEMAKDSSESFFFLADYHSIIKNNNFWEKKGGKSLRSGGAPALPEPPPSHRPIGW